MTPLFIYVAPVQGQRKPNKDKHDAATTPLSLRWQISLIASLLSSLFSRSSFRPLMFIQVLIIILFPTLHHHWYSWLFLSSLLFSPSLLFFYILHLYHLILIALTALLISSSPSPLSPPSPPSLPCDGEVLTATHSGMAANKRAKQKVDSSCLSLITHPCSPCIWCKNPGGHPSIPCVISCTLSPSLPPETEWPLDNHCCKYFIIRSGNSKQ